VTQSSIAQTVSELDALRADRDNWRAEAVNVRELYWTAYKDGAKAALELRHALNDRDEALDRLAEFRSRCVCEEAK